MDTQALDTAPAECHTFMCMFILNRLEMKNSLRSVVTVLGGFALMVACGLIAFGGAVTFLMNLGLKLHNNYEYYGRFFLARAFMYGSGAIGFVTPGVILWQLRNRNVRFSLRLLLLVTTVVAILIGLYGLSF